MRSSDWSSDVCSSDRAEADPGDVAALNLLGLQLHRHDVAARAGFGHGKAADMLARDQPRQIFRLLLWIAPAADLVDVQIRMQPEALRVGQEGVCQCRYRGLTDG